MASPLDQESDTLRMLYVLSTNQGLQVLQRFRYSKDNISQKQYIEMRRIGDSTNLKFKTNMI